eukprot:jgi/Ulvmu1/2390/UM130_0023.1
MQDCPPRSPDAARQLARRWKRNQGYVWNSTKNIYAPDVLPGWPYLCLGLDTPGARGRVQLDGTRTISSEDTHATPCVSEPSCTAPASRC